MKPSPLSSCHPLLEILLRNFDPLRIPLDLGACAISQPHNSSLSVEKVTQCLDEFAQEAMAIAQHPEDPESRLDAVREVLFLRHGFSGNVEDYYSPENSFIDRVIETRKGIPITLSLLFLETARRAGVELEGYGLPCHFMVGHRSEGRLRLFDAFNGGEEKTIEDCIRQVHQLSGGSVVLTHSDFVPTTPRNILLRMLMNLRGIFRNRGETPGLIPVLEQILMLGGEDAAIHGELALHLAETGRLADAHHHLETYTNLVEGSCGNVPTPAWLNRIRAGFSTFN